MTEMSNCKEQEQRVEALEMEVAKAKEKEKESQEREKLWLDLVNNAVVGVYRTTEDGKFLLVNRKLVQIFGFDSPHEFLASVPDVSLLYLNPEDRQVILSKLKGSGFVDGAEVQARRKDGQIIWISINARKTEQIPGGEVFEGFIIDISERKHAEESLQESEKRFRMLVEQAGDAFFIHDYTGKIFDVNTQACKSLGYTREELLKMRISDVDIEVQKKKHKPRFWEPLASGQYINFEGIHLRKDGSTFPVEVRLGRLDLGEQKFLLSLTRDITERKKAEDNLRNAFQEITKLKNLLERENIYLRQEIELQYRHEKIVGESAAIKKVLHEAEKVAKEETYVLIQGETGTGKELLARAIHNISPRKGRPMIMVNCAAIPPTLIESELFGREKGAFTGAVSKQIGRFEAADGSTLFLDEISDLPQELQAKLLRVLQDGRFERLGSSETISVDVRVIAATNQDLAELVREKKFRRDLYYRLNVFPITIPPLREREEDIPLLVWAFIREFEQSMGKSIMNISRKTMDFFQSYSWPGNVRELRNVIERAMILTTGPNLHIDHFEGGSSTTKEKVTLREMERKHIIQILEGTGWRVSGKKGAAQLLGLKESTLRSRMMKLGIKRPGEC
jgi:formate hydrogenlyase transcriptional activator